MDIYCTNNNSTIKMLHYETFNRTIVKLNQIENSPKNQVLFVNSSVF